METLVLIPARKGSKRLPSKNLQRVGNASLLQRTIDHALQVVDISRVFVSSDSTEILDIARQNGVIPVNRPQELATDSSTANDVVSHFIEFIETRSSYAPKSTSILYLQPTSPFRRVETTQACMEMFSESGKPVVTIKTMHQHPHKALRLNHGRIETLHEQTFPTANHQDLPDFFVATGALYIFSIVDFLQTNVIPIAGAMPFIVDELEGMDIDTYLDLRIADILEK